MKGFHLDGARQVWGGEEPLPKGAENLGRQYFGAKAL